MAQAPGAEPSMDLRPLIELVGPKQVIEVLGQFREQLSPEEVESLKRLLS